MKSIVPMIHVPDVRATVEWYAAIGFTLVTTNEDNGEMDWALLTFGDGAVMFSEGGRVTTDDRREVDLYVHTDDVSECHERLKGSVEIVEGLHDTFYGMREFIIRDMNRFWMTFGEPTPGV
ncbi:MAG: hypothetical protein HYR56_05335 [Acidobacteria bacterium]|nr:hypothetical protein [Acidobacteriota bacterium]MBI3424536.1 hypothetical protein [Acidobacteriota bacterium]